MGLSTQVRASLVCLGAATALVGCSLSPSSLTTGSLFGSDSAPKVATAVVAPETPADRALHVGATTARAQRCGYVFDPQGTRAAYLAYEAQRGTTGEVLAKTEKSYDYTVASIGKNISGNADYCDDEQTAIIKRDLGKMLAGDFSAPAKKANPVTDNWWGNPTSNDKFDRDKALNRDKAI